MVLQVLAARDQPLTVERGDEEAAALGVGEAREDLIGERAPTWPENLQGAIVGLKNSSSALDILQATREAVFQRLAQIAELLPIRKFVISGGIQKSPADVQRLADE